MRTAAAAPIPPGRRPPRAALLAALGLALGGCVPTEPGLRVATDLTPTERRQLEPLVPVNDPSVRWITVGPGIDPAALADRVDLILRSRPVVDRQPDPRLHWSAGPARVVGLKLNDKALDERALIRPRSVQELDASTWTELVALDDPRRDAATAALARHVLSQHGWSDGYRSLVGLAGRSTVVGGGGAGAARLARGEAAACPILVLRRDDADLPLGDGPALEVAIVKNSPHVEMARLWQTRLAQGAAAIAAPAAEMDLLLDLLGSTLVDAQDELVQAVSALSTGSAPETTHLDDRLREAPPWPPASVEALKAVDPDGSLLDSLAEQVAPGLEARYWLLQSWEQPTRPLDAAMLARIADAAGGKLARDQRFRAWLRADWVAWARQRYRRVARRAIAAAAATGPRS